MKISQAIEELESLREEHGDMSLKDFNGDDVKTIELEHNKKITRIRDTVVLIGERKVVKVY